MVRGQWASLARMPGLHPYSFSKNILGFLMTTESQDLGLTYHPKDGKTEEPKNDRTNKRMNEQGAVSLSITCSFIPLFSLCAINSMNQITN